MISLQFDGLFSEVATDNRRAGFLCYGWLIWRGSLVVARGHGGVARAQDATSNVAEYIALIEGLDALSDQGDHHEPVQVFGDAKCVIDQMSGTSDVNSPAIQPLYRKACKLADDFTSIEWHWKPRRHNREADRLTRLAMRQILTDPDCYQKTLQTLETCCGQRAFEKVFPTARSACLFAAKPVPKMAIASISARRSFTGIIYYNLDLVMKKDGDFSKPSIPDTDLRCLTIIISRSIVAPNMQVSQMSPCLTTTPNRVWAGVGAPGWD